MNTLNTFDEVHPEQALRDARVISRAIYPDPQARNGKHHLILKDGQHLIFVLAYQHTNTTINPTGEHWSGGTQIEIPTPAFIWLLQSIEMHRQQTSCPVPGHRPTRADTSAPTPKAKPTPIPARPTVKCRGETLSIARTPDQTAYTLHNHSRPVHLPWANANWHQKLELTDRLLFEQGYWSVLKKLAATLRPAQAASAIMAAV